jgi:hypothetical protein
MKAISLWQPWASLWLTPRMRHLTRHWSTSHRGWLAIHAAKSWERDLSLGLRDLLKEEFGPDWQDSLPMGAVVGAVELIEVVPTEQVYGDMLDDTALDDLLCGDFSPGRHAWKRGAFRRLPTTFPFVGKQGFFEVPDEVMTELA